MLFRAFEKPFALDLLFAKIYGFIKRSAVDANSDGGVFLFCFLDNSLNAFFASDVAWVDSDGIDTSI